MKDTVYDIIQVILIFSFVVGIVIGLVKCSNDKGRAEWNDGYCECGGHWIYEQAVGHQMRTSYIYRCDKCGKMIEVWNTNVMKGGAK